MTKSIIPALLLSGVLMAVAALGGDSKKQYTVECQVIRDGEIHSRPHTTVFEGQGVSFSVAKDVEVAGQSVKVGSTLIVTNSVQEGTMLFTGKMTITEVMSISEVSAEDTKWGLFRTYDWVFSVKDPDPEKWYSPPEVKDGMSIRIKVTPISGFMARPK